MCQPGGTLAISSPKHIPMEPTTSSKQSTLVAHHHTNKEFTITPSSENLQEENLPTIPYMLDYNVGTGIVRSKGDSNSSPPPILSTNTSSIPIGRIAAQTLRSEKVIGMHFMNPVPVMKLVEVIRSIATSQETFDLTWALCEQFGKTPAEANDFPGFIANRILMPMINEAIFCLYQSVGKAEDIDTVMKLGMNHPMGPLALADLIGLDTCLAIMETLYDGFKDSKYRPCPLLRKYVEVGWLGRKTGKGFYEYK